MAGKKAFCSYCSADWGNFGLLRHATSRADGHFNYHLWQKSTSYYEIVYYLYSTTYLLELEQFQSRADKKMKNGGLSHQSLCKVWWGPWLSTSLNFWESRHPSLTQRGWLLVPRQKSYDDALGPARQRVDDAGALKSLNLSPCHVVGGGPQLMKGSCYVVDCYRNKDHNWLRKKCSSV